MNSDNDAIKQIETELKTYETNEWKKPKLEAVTLLTLSIPTDSCHSCIGYHTVVSEMTLLFTRGIVTKFVCLAPSHDNGLKGS